MGGGRSEHHGADAMVCFRRNSATSLSTVSLDSGINSGAAPGIHTVSSRLSALGGLFALTTFDSIASVGLLPKILQVGALLTPAFLLMRLLHSKTGVFAERLQRNRSRWFARLARAELVAQRHGDPHTFYGRYCLGQRR